MTAVFTTSDNNFATAKWIVDATAGKGTHTTIATALTSASSGDTIFIRPGTYTENLTLKAGVNLSSFSCDSLTPNVIILGKATATFVGTCSISGIQLKTNSDFCLSVTGSSATIIQLINCYIDCNNNNAIQFTSSSGSSKVELRYCKGDTDTTGIAYFTHSAAGALKFYHCAFENDGVSTTASTASSGALSFYNCFYNGAITTSSTNDFTMSNTEIHGALIVAGSGANNISTSYLDGAASSAVTINTNTLTMASCAISSTNTNAISGSGTLTYNGLSYNNTSVTMNTTTQTPSYMDIGKYRARGQPAFYAYLAGDASAVVGNSSTPYKILFDTLAFDQSSNYSSSTFTAPVAGRYFFCALARLKAITAAMTYGDIRMVTTGVTVLGNEANIGTGQTVAGASGQYGLVGSWLVNMAANDTAFIQVLVQGGASAAAGIIGTQSGGSYFMGYLVA